jgi:hypothetical protein
VWYYCFMPKETIQIRRDNMPEQKQNLADAAVLAALGLALRGIDTLEGEKRVEFMDADEENKRLVLSFVTGVWLEQWVSSDPNFYSQGMTLATNSPFPPVKEKALTLLGRCLCEWCISSPSGQSERLWDKDLPQTKKTQHITGISSQLVDLAESDEDVLIRGQAARLLSAFAQNTYNPYIGVKDTGQFYFLERFNGLVENEQNPQAKADKLLAYLEFVTEPDVYGRFASYGDGESGYYALMLGWKETVSSFVDDPKNAIEALRLITTIYLSPLLNLQRLKQERGGPLNLEKIRDIALNADKQIKQQAIKMAEDLLVMLMRSREIRGLSLEVREEIRREIASLFFGNK